MTTEINDLTASSSSYASATGDEWIPISLRWLAKSSVRFCLVRSCGTIPPDSKICRETSPTIAICSC